MRQAKRRVKKFKLIIDCIRTEFRARAGVTSTGGRRMDQKKQNVDRGKRRGRLSANL